MIQKYWLSFVFLIIFLSTQAFSADKEKGRVWFQNDTIFYQGGLHKELNSQLYSLYQKHSKQVKWVSITSSGGDVNLGLDLGEFIFMHDLSVKIPTLCFSSCANYVFTAAATKLIETNAVVGWHGGASSTSFDLSSYEKQLASLPDEQRQELIKHFEEYLQKWGSREAKFFKKVDVEQKVTTLGQKEEYTKFRKEGFAGWYYSIADMAKLGIKNVVINGAVWQPSPEQANPQMRLYKVELKNTQ